MSGAPPVWHSFDPSSGSIPEEAQAAILPDEGKGRIVAITPTESASSDDWSVQATYEIARSWAETGLRVFLMDLSLERPVLHEAFQMENQEGVSDALAFGASVQRIAHPVLDGAVFFASAGTKTADPEAILGHERWADLADAFVEAGATLLLYFPPDLPGASSLLERVTEVVFLAGQGESASAELGDAAEKVVSILGPISTGGVEAPPEEEVAEAVEEARDESSVEEPQVAEGGFGLADGLGEGDAPGGELDAFSDFAMEAPAEGEAVEEGAEGESVFDFGGGLEFERSSEGEEQEAAAPEGDGMEMGGEAAPEMDGTLGDSPGFEMGPDLGGDFGDGLVTGPELGGRDEEGPAFEAPPAGGYGEAPGAPTGVAEPPADDAGVPGAPGVGEVEDKPVRERPPPPRPKARPPKKRSKGGLWVLILLAAVVGVGGAGFLGVVSIPGIPTLADLQGGGETGPPVRVGPQPTDEVLGYSLMIDRYRLLTGHSDFVDALEERLPDLLFILVPMEEEGAPFFLLMAGPATTSGAANALKGPIGEVLTRENPATWLVRETPLAYHVGETQTLEAADSRVVSLMGMGIPAYILQVTFPDGTEAFRLYAGAYASVEEAEFLQGVIEDNRLGDAPLVERRGRLPE